MAARLLQLLRDRRVLGAGDIVLAVVLAGTSLVGVLTGNLSWGRPVGLALALALLSTLPVAWRTRTPLAAAAVVLLANGACVYAAAPNQAGFQPFVALVLVAYSLGSRSGVLWAPPVLAVGAVPLFVAAGVHGQSVDNLIPSYLWLIAAWAVGRTVRGWRERTLELQAANRELAEQRELQARAAVMVERGRIARELHDVVAHNVSMMVVQASAAARVLDGDQPHVRIALEVIADTGRQTVDEMRRLLGVLRSDDDRVALGPQPGLADLEKLVHGVREAGLPVTLRIEGRPQGPLPQALDLSAYRIVQEALTNSLKHAGPAHAEVVLSYHEDCVEVHIADTSTAPPPASAPRPAGQGLVGMRERVALFGGDLFAAPTGGGFTVRARLPLAAPAPS